MRRSPSALAGSWINLLNAKSSFTSTKISKQVFSQLKGRHSTWLLDLSLLLQVYDPSSQPPPRSR
ncbi:hypothetical protein GGE12_004263 [Rhizobium mongolense]|uniref:Uncharacterized protein n=1 Tax=Rhizobium mongolense TaxID=57676 RepID=A0A7W6RR01_9HYPH|nr:hypothetical protein [Rhizobium mongolense]